MAVSVPAPSMTGTRTGAEPVPRSGSTELRRINETIAMVGRSFAVPVQLRFLCECGEPACSRRVALRLREYDSIRRRGAAVVAEPA